MKRLALRGSVRRVLTRVHRWSGLTVMVCLAIAAATGGVIAFRDEIDRFVNPHLRVVTPGRSLAPLDRIVNDVEARFPDASVSTVTLQTRPDESLRVYLQKKAPGPGALRANEVFVDPYTGAVLGHINTAQVLFSREYLIPSLIRLHYSLLLEQPGVWIMATSAIVWLITIVVGLALAWPSVWRRGRSWKPILAIRRAGSYKINYDLHRALGVAGLPVWIVLAFTSVFLNLPGPVISMTGAIAPLTAPPSGHPLGAPVSVSADEALMRARQSMPGAEPYGFTRDLRNGWYSIRLQLPGDINLAGNNRVYVDMATGEVVSSRRYERATPGDRFLEWQFPLHSGEAFGLPGRIAIVLAALAMVTMSATGFFVWWRKWVQRRRLERRMKQGLKFSSDAADEEFRNSSDAAVRSS